MLVNHVSGDDKHSWEVTVRKWSVLGTRFQLGTTNVWMKTMGMVSCTEMPLSCLKQLENLLRVC